MNAVSPQNHRGPAHQVRWTAPQRLLDLWQALLSTAARPLRFAAVGGVAGLVQLALLVLLKGLGMAAIPANVVAYLLSAQLNFLLSNRFIWHDRWSREASGADLLRRWAAFHGSIAGTFVLSQAIFIAARLAAADVVASGLGIGGAAIVNFVIQDRLTFQRIQASRPPAALPVAVAPGERTRPQRRRIG